MKIPDLRLNVYVWKFEFVSFFKYSIPEKSLTRRGGDEQSIDT